MTETPKYSVMQKDKEIELRLYPSYIQAEVDVDAKDYKSAIEQGFNILAGYIFGSNTSRQRIAMTIPVQVSEPERIAMTAPVKVSQSARIAMTTPVTVRVNDTFTVAFIMPSEYSLDTLPLPKDNNIRFTPVPAQQMAAIRFTGYFRQDTITKNKERLGQWLAEKGLKTEGDYIIAGYNPPWVPGFLARNEVLIKIKESGKS
jgi:hypothetical protein